MQVVSVIETLRRRPELIVGPALALWLAANCLPIAFGQPFILTVIRIASFHNPPGNAFPVTYGCALALFAFTLFALRAISWPRRLLVAIAVPFAFTHLYEIPYELIAYEVWYPLYNWALWPTTLFLNATWLILGVSSAPFWKFKRWGVVALAAFLVAFAAWWIWFVPFVPPIHPPTNPEGSGYILSHALLVFVLACLIWDGRPGTDSGPAQTTAPVGGTPTLPGSPVALLSPSEEERVYAEGSSSSWTKPRRRCPPEAPPEGRPPSISGQTSEAQQSGGLLGGDPRGRLGGHSERVHRRLV